MPQTEITDIHDFAAKTRMLIKKMDELKAERDALMAELNEKNENQRVECLHSGEGREIQNLEHCQDA